ncbi:uncharacterized protein [Dysidea avara]|uniref:uncharacterized protein n=1 Tax=Dysidea avara TaxID=196820 RepID=UPI00332936DC
MLKFLVVLAVLFTCNVRGERESIFKPRCDKIDQCSCKLRNVRNPGIITLHPLVSGKPTARFAEYASSKDNGDYYNYFYNPCVSFSVAAGSYSVCNNVSMCQTMTDGYQSTFNLGTIDSAEFVYRNGSVIIMYQSGGPSYNNRTTEVELVCDANEVLGRLEFVSEYPIRFYKFKLFTQCACPGKCTSVKKECIMRDSCSCEMSDGTGVINLHSIDNPDTPMEDSISSSETYWYNPCSPVTSPDCDGNSVCGKYSNSNTGLGFSNSTKFIADGDSVAIQYSNTETGKASTVHLNCDRGARNKPYFRFEGSEKDEYFMSLDSVCACPGECGTPALPPIQQCNQIDSCSCKVRETGQIISLHKLDNPSAPFKVFGTDGYVYYYNPCSGIQLETNKGQCVGVSACKGDLYFDHDSFTVLGGISSTFISYDSNNITLRYDGGNSGTYYDVQFICDPNVISPEFAVDEHLSSYYKFNLTTSVVCF